MAASNKSIADQCFPLLDGASAVVIAAIARPMARAVSAACTGNSARLPSDEEVRRSPPRVRGTCLFFAFDRALTRLGVVYEDHAGLFEGGADGRLRVDVPAYQREGGEHSPD